MGWGITGRFPIAPSGCCLCWSLQHPEGGAAGGAALVGATPVQLAGHCSTQAHRAAAAVGATPSLSPSPALRALRVNLSSCRACKAHAAHAALEGRHRLRRRLPRAPQSTSCSLEELAHLCQTGYVMRARGPRGLALASGAASAQAGAHPPPALSRCLIWPRSVPGEL